MATFYQKAKLLKGLLSGETAHTGPIYASVDVTHRCNLRCLCCSNHSREVNKESPGGQAVQDIPFALFEKLCSELKKAGTRRITISGKGEPLLHPRILDMISAARENGLKVKLFTNGTLLDEARISSLIDSGLDIIMVSLWAGSPVEYEKNYPGSDPANFAKVVDGLKLLSYLKAEKKSTSPYVVLYQPVNRINFQNIGAMVDLALETGCNDLSFAPLNTVRGQFDEFALKPDEERSLCLSLVRQKSRLLSTPIKHNIDRCLLMYKMGAAAWKKQPCHIGWYHARIDTNGVVVPCGRCRLPMGNLNENSFAEIWNGPAYRAFRTDTITREGLASLDGRCNCVCCCHVPENRKIHRYFRWLSPLFVRRRRAEI